MIYLAAGVLLILIWVVSAARVEAARTPEENRVLEYVDTNKNVILEQWKELIEIPGTSRKEEARVQWIKREMLALGLQSVEVDDIGNVIGIWPGSSEGSKIVFAAHMDTVFPLDTDLTVTIRDGWLHAPGAADNTSSVIALLHTIRALKEAGFEPKTDLVFMATVREETGLAGAEHYLANTSQPVGMFVAVDGSLGGVTFGALGIQWWRVKYKVKAYHTLESKGKPNAALALSRLIQRLYEIRVPEEPMTVLNVGTIGGGSATNAVCEEAELTVDLRSQSPTELTRLVNQVLGKAYSTAAECEADIEVERFNNIAAGILDNAEKHVLTQTAIQVLRDLGIEPELSTLGATDANPAIVRGIPGIAIGVVKGRGIHSIEESARIDSIYDGIKQVILLAMRLGS